MDFFPLDGDNIGQVVPLFVDAFNAPPWSDGWTTHAAHERLRAFTCHPRFAGLALRDQGQLLGFALGWAERWVDDWQFHLYEICVAPRHQRAGHGRALMKAMEEQACAAGCSVLFLETRADTQALPFYRSLGYVDGGLVGLGKRCRPS